MLWTPGCDFGWTADNFGATYSNAGFATNSPGHANANAKGANTNLLSGIAEDCFGLSIVFANGTTSAGIRRNLVDILIDPNAGAGNAGTSWSVLIANLFCCSASLVNGGYQYYFPIFLKAGTAIGSANQSVTASTSALRVGVRVYGKPTRPELLRVGSKVETFGAVTASTSGTSITPGTNAMGSYTASLGTTSYDQFWWQGGIGFDDTTLGNDEMEWLEIAAGDATNKQTVASGIIWTTNSAESGFKSAMGIALPMRQIASGANVYMRAAGGAAPQTTPQVVAYGVGG